jgi:hypothetical protein
MNQLFFSKDSRLEILILAYAAVCEAKISLKMFRCNFAGYIQIYNDFWILKSDPPAWPTTLKREVTWYSVSEL